MRAAAAAELAGNIAACCRLDITAPCNDNATAAAAARSPGGGADIVRDLFVVLLSDDVDTAVDFDSILNCCFVLLSLWNASVQTPVEHEIEEEEKIAYHCSVLIKHQFINIIICRHSKMCCINSVGGVHSLLF